VADLPYMRDDISVDENFARFGAKSYAINKINSVEVKTIEAEKNPTGGLVFVTVILALIALISTSIWWLLGAIFFGVGAFHSYRNPKMATYQLYLMTSSSEVQALETQDKEQITNLRAAIEAAMSRK
jgi:hypothetical protein